MTFTQYSEEQERLFLEIPFDHLKSSQISFLRQSNIETVKWVMEVIDRYYLDAETLEANKILIAIKSELNKAIE